MHDHLGELPRRALREPEPQELFERVQPRRRRGPRRHARRDPATGNPQLARHPRSMSQIREMTMMQKANFMKNPSRIGACLLVMDYGSVRTVSIAGPR